MASVAEGPNYRIELDDNGIASCRVWKRPDLSSDEGARLAHEKIATFEKLARAGARAMIFDLSEAPPITGPKTEEALGRMLATFETAHKRIAIVVGGAAVQKLQLSRLVSRYAPTTGRVFGVDGDVRSWVLPAQPRPPRGRPQGA